MYIPKPYLADCLTTEISASGGDVIYDYITGSQIRRVHYFGWNTGSHQFEVHEGCTDSTELFLVGGGGAGGFGEIRTTGSGTPYFLGPPSSYIGCANAAYQAGGGGGAGGLLHINSLREATGSLQLVAGKYPVYVGKGGTMTYPLHTDGTQNISTNGEDTTFRYKFRLANDADIPSGSSTSSRYEYDSITIKGGGGGHGGFNTWEVIAGITDCGNTNASPQWYQIANPAGSGGAGGGSANNSCGGSNRYGIGLSGSNEYPFGNQGYDGSWYYTPGTTPIVTQGYGGGGVGSQTASFSAEAIYSGIGITDYARGVAINYGYGGQGGSGLCGDESLYQNIPINSQLPSTGSDQLFYKGTGGTAYQYYATSSWSSTIQDNYFNGVDGEAIITYALTGSQLTNGKQYYLDGGVSGGIFTFIPCGEVRVETLEVPAGKQACICALSTPTYLGGTYREQWWDNIPPPASGSDLLWTPDKMMDLLPSGSGTVTFTTGSSCKTYVPFEGWEVCGPCNQSSPAGIYIGFDISGSSGSPFHRYPDTTIQYTSSQDIVSSSRYNNHDSESYYQTRIGAFSNDYIEDTPLSNYPPSASFNTSYPNQNVDFTTGSQCFTYYDCVSLDTAPITASGGIEGTFLSGSFIYKYHIFEASGSANEATTRSFQELTISNGYADDVNILVIGPGGPGGPATGSNDGNLFYGGGGGAGQVKIEKLNGLCNAYNLKIAPGFAYPTLEGNSPTPDVWQEFFGQTIISASDGIYYTSAGIGGRGSAPLQFNGNTTMGDWNSRSGSGGGGAGISSLVSDGYITGGYDTLQTNGGDGFNGTGSAGGGGGAGQDGFDGSGGITAQGGEGGEGLRLNLDGTLRWYAGGGAGYGPGGPSDGGIGGGGTSGIGLSTGSFYGAGGGAWLGPSTGYTAPWGTSYILNGRGADGAVIINYKWKFNTSPTGSIVIRGLSQYYDIYDENSYDGTGSLVYSLWSNDTTASLGNEGGWGYNTTVLDGSGSLEVVTSSLHPYIETEAETTSEISMLVTWFSNDVIYDGSGKYPILAMENFGTSSLGLYAGDLATYDEAVVIRLGDTEVVTEPDTAGNYVPRFGFHISQFSYNQGLNQLLWYVDGYSGSVSVSEEINTKDIIASFNSSSQAIGLGNDSTFAMAVIYTSSLDWDEMRHNDDFLYPRY